MKYLKHINEFLNNDMIYLKKYFSMSEEDQKKSLPYEYSYLFEDFLEDEDIDFDMNDMEHYEIVEYLENNNIDLFNDFANYLYKNVINHKLNILVGDYPAWSFFDNDPQLIKNQWLIHFTNDAESIAKYGFKYGVDDYTKLGLTTTLGEFEKNMVGIILLILLMILISMLEQIEEIINMVKRWYYLEHLVLKCGIILMKNHKLYFMVILQRILYL